MGRWVGSARKRALGRGVLFAGIALGVGSTGCTGVLEGNPLDQGSVGATSASGGSGAGAAGGASGGLGAGAGVGPGGSAANAPGYKPIHRLNAYEYNATVADVLGTALQPANGSWQVYEVNGFDNMADVQHLDEAQFQRFFDAAGALADDALARADFKSKFLSCGTADDACVSSIIGKLGLHLFRRPLKPTEITNYLGVYHAAAQQGEDPAGSVKQVLRAFLVSSEFLYRMEFDDNPASPNRHPLTSYELASRLSYLLWSSAPDDALLAAAADDSITKDETITATVHRLLSDPARAPRFVQNFYGQWLGARRVASHAVSPSVYTAWSPALASSMTAEMYAYFADFLNNDRSWLEFLTADESFVDQGLATFYGMPAPSGPGLQKVAYTADKRAGFLGLGGFLAMSSYDRRTSPTLRARWILINLLCTQPPPPPMNVPMLDVAAGGTDLSKGNVRAILEKHRADPFCANCHSLFDPYGLPLEEFDGIGAYRTTYADGSNVALDTQLKDGTKLTGASELADVLTKDPRFTQCISDNLYSYGLGRLVTSADRDALNGIQQTWSNGKDVPSIRRLIETTTLDPTFRSRSGASM